MILAELSWRGGWWRWHERVLQARYERHVGLDGLLVSHVEFGRADAGHLYAPVVLALPFGEVNYPRASRIGDIHAVARVTLQQTASSVAAARLSNAFAGNAHLCDHGK